MNEDAILARLDDLKDRVGRLDERQQQEGRDTRQEITSLRVVVAGLKVKAGVWGAVAGFLPALAALLLWLLKP